ncbi:hypothetical protein D6851_01235 [Altericroceibacterium spongiae]|uniref:Uncharacterized protein n=1 Tax=Altericroceibacterium spongiae TaxID=2320269 RepID=A0A420ESA9_9SPHN|nr:hypothetical protein [Altericroceibacterium spongiae]RKF23568.1 hypothetical protein D6851_01235 [Altericroceibacterium spongiae]
MFRNFLIGAAALGLVAAPVAAQAGTRASASVPVANAATQSAVTSFGARSSTSVKKDEKVVGAPILFAVLGVAAVAATVAVVDDDDDDDISAGT